MIFWKGEKHLVKGILTSLKDKLVFKTIKVFLELLKEISIACSCLKKERPSTFLNVVEINSITLIFVSLSPLKLVIIVLIKKD